LGGGDGDEREMKERIVWEGGRSERVKVGMVYIRIERRVFGV
jgi:hypothetical protein